MSAVGLTSAQARERLARFGANELPRPARPGLVRRSAGKLADPTAVLLAVAGLVSLAVLGDVAEGVAILAIVALNVAVAVAQEARADAASDALAAMVAPTAVVFRDGTAQRLPAAALVPGDVLELAAGDRVPADATLLEAQGLRVDESTLTGESAPAGKWAGGARSGALADRSGEVFAGTLAVAGRGRAEVSATGAASRIGEIAGRLSPRRPAPLQRDLAQATGRVGLLALGVAAVAVALGLLRSHGGTTGVVEVLLAGVALAIAAVPESLPAAVTAALALGARRMAGRGVIVRRLAAVEALGAASVICADKTGTLTEGRLSVARAVPLPGREQALWEIAAGCNDAVDGEGDPVDVALAAAVPPGVEPGERLAAEPFDPRTRQMAVCVRTLDGPRVLVKGAPEVVLGRCVPGPATDLAAAAVGELTAAGLRVLALADAAGTDLRSARLRCAGLVALADQPRASAAAAVRDCREAGISVVMVTGDHAGTASAIAAQVGIGAAAGPAGDHAGERAIGGAAVVTGDELPADPVERSAALRAASVVARVEPATKVELVEAYHDAGRVVAMTGDGVNDAPALRAADVGVAVVGSGGTDVAREAASVVLTEPDLGTIVAGVAEGRRIFANVAAMVEYLVAGNLSEIVIVLVGLLAWTDLAVPLLPVQLLWINLVTDGLPVLALGVDRQLGSPLHQPPRDPAQSLLGAARLRRIAVRAGAVAGGVLLAAEWMRHAGWSTDQLRTGIVTCLVCAHLVLAYLARARRAAFEPGWWRARALLLAVAGSLALQALLAAVPTLGHPFGFAPMPWQGWLAALACGALTVAVGDGYRALEKRSA